MNAPRDFRTPLKRAVGLGSAKDGTGHFIWQRITAIVVVLCGVYLLGLLFGMARAEYLFARGMVADPLNACILIAFLIAAFWHAKLGLQVVIEDYVHDALPAGLLHLANILICALAAIAGVFAVVRIALSGA